MLRAISLCLALCLAPLGGCSLHRADALPLSAERLEAGAWFFRHKVTLEFPGQDMSFSFDGLMRLDTRAGIVHSAGIAGLGMQMFEMTVTRDWELVSYLHPALAKLPGAGEQLARCIRQIWFDCLLNMPQTTAAEQKTWSFAASGGPEQGLWPERMRYVDARVPFVLTVRLLQAQQEDMP